MPAGQWFRVEAGRPARCGQVATPLQPGKRHRQVHVRVPRRCGSPACCIGPPLPSNSTEQQHAVEGGVGFTFGLTTLGQCPYCVEVPRTSTACR
jgi:hypothetical protein